MYLYCTMFDILIAGVEYRNYFCHNWGYLKLSDVIWNTYGYIQTFRFIYLFSATGVKLSRQPEKQAWQFPINE